MPSQSTATVDNGQLFLFTAGKKKAPCGEGLAISYKGE